MTILLKLILVYLIIGFLAMWLTEDVVYQAIIKEGTMTKKLSDSYDHLFGLPLSYQLILFGLCWPLYFPKLILLAIVVLF